MKELIKSLIKSLRLKINKIKKTDKKYIIEAIDLIMKTKKIKSYVVYLSGSHSLLNNKNPSKNSDIDIYILLNKKYIKNKLGVEENKNISNALKILTGFNIQLFFIDIEYNSLLKKQMERIK